MPAVDVWLCRSGGRSQPGRYRERVDLVRLEEELVSRGEPAFRAGQVWGGPARGAAGYDAMTNVPRSLREALTEAVPFSTLDLVTEARSHDGTVKALFSGTADGHPVEAVLMRYRTGRRCPRSPAVAHVHVLRHGRDALRPQPDGLREATRCCTSDVSNRSTIWCSWGWESR